MSRMFIAAAVLVVLVLGVVQQLETVVQVPTAASAVKANPTPAPAVSNTMVIKVRGNGQFEVDTIVEGRRIVMVVDTGASHVTLRASDAARAAFYPSRNDYTVSM